MAELKPNFALDLSNDGIALWHRNSGAGWESLAKIALDDPELDNKLKSMRHLAQDKGQPLHAVVRIPRSEVLLSRIRLGVFEGEAASTDALKKIEALTPYALDEVAYDLGEKTVGNMAPIGVVARSTLIEAESFAQQQGFIPVYYTTQYTTKEFQREPRFRLTTPKTSRLPLVSKVAAAAAVGLTLGYFGYSSLIGTDPGENPETAVAAINASSENANPSPSASAAEKRVNPDGEPNFSASQVATFIPPPTTKAAGSFGQPIEPLSIPPIERLDRLAALDNTGAPFVDQASDVSKTDALTLVEARRDLPDVALNDEVVSIIQSSMNLADPKAIPSEAPIVLASLTPPNTAYDTLIESILDAPIEAYAPPPANAADLPDAPPPPPAFVTAESGTLTPTPDGTLGPENILIFSGRPPVEARSRPVVEPPADPLAEFRPRSRPEGLLSAEQLAALQEPTEANVAEVDEAAETVEVIDPETETAVVVEAEEAIAPETETAALTPEEQSADTEPLPEGSAENDPSSVEAPVVAEEALAEVEPPAEAPETDTAEAETETEDTTDNSLLALADQTLIGKKSRARPDNLNVPVTSDPNEFLASADPALAGFRAKNRPANLKIPAETPEISSENTLDTATALAVSTSPVPKLRPAKIASIAAKVKSPAQNAAKDAAAPSDVTVAVAKGTSKPSKSPTSTTVASAATEKARFNKQKMNLVGVFGRPNDRRALVRLSSGRYVKVKKGDRLSGWKVSAIGESSVRINKGTKDQVLRMP